MKWRNVYLNDDLSPEEQHKRREMRCIAALAKSRGIRCQLKNGGLVIDDQRYTHSDMERLPYGLSMTEAKIVKVDDGTAFQGHHAFMSNMFHVNIKYEGHTYSSAEHLYQTMCVEACNDNELAKEIKRTVDPYLARSLAKKVKKTKKWHESKLKVMEKIIRLKFDQNDAIRAKLQNTTGNLYEATTDKVFGCGLKVHRQFPKRTRPVARGGGVGGVVRPPPQLPIPKILFHPLAILFHPLAILFHLSAILFHPLAILFHPSAILFHPSAILFHPLAILFHPWNMDDVTRAMSKGGCL